MEAGESDPNPGGRKRTESNSGNSDSDFSDGWNIVDHMDVHNPDVPSSDGESVEVIDTESAYHDEEEEEYEQPDGGNNQLLLKRKTPVVPADEGELSVPGHRPIVLPQEEMFDSSFCWFLFFAVSALLVSDVAFMVAESVFDWNVGVSKYVDQPSFLTDLPVTSKLPQHHKSPSKIAWASKEEVSVDSVDISGDELEEKIVKSSKERSNSKNKYYNRFYENRQKLSLKIDNSDIGKYFRDLRDVTVSNEAKNKFSQTLLILDALHIGLNDLEAVATESTELHQVLKSQRETLVNALAEIESGVTRAMERMATNVLDKVQRLERNFEKHWCGLERTGYKDELKGLFYDCQENEGKNNRYEKRGQFEAKSVQRNRVVKDSYQYEVDRDSTGKEYNRHESSKGSYVNYDFLRNERHAKGEYDDKNKHSRSLDCSNSHEDEKLVNFDEINAYEKKDNQNSFKENKKNDNVNEQKRYDSNSFNKEKNKRPNHEKSAKHENPGEYYNKKSDKESFDKDRKYSNAEHRCSSEKDDQTRISANKKSEHNEKSGKYDHTKSKHQHFVSDEIVGTFEHIGSDGKYLEQSNKHDKKVKFETSKDYREKSYDMKSSQKEQNKNSFSDESTHEEQKSGAYNSQEPKNFIKAAADKLGKFLKEKCDKHRQKTTDLYNKVKERVTEKMKIPLEIFNRIFNKYCSTNQNNQRKDEQKNEQLKGEYRRNNRDRKMQYYDESTTLGDYANTKSFVDLKLTDSNKDKGSTIGKKGDDILELSEKLPQWTSLLYESPSPNNESNLEGYWFFKAGDSRSKARRYQRRSDWMFERATHRRGGGHTSPHQWFAGRRKNWFFRRAWAREQCRETPDSRWCHPAHDEALTLSGASCS